MKVKIDAIISHTDKEIKGFFYDFRFLSNFYPCLVFYEGHEFPSSENAYQFAKLENGHFEYNEIREHFKKITPNQSKKSSRLLPIKKDWEEIKIYIMSTILLDKFNRNEDLKKLLKETNNKYLEETNYWKDIYWGVCNGVGENNLGKILMEIRKKLN